MLCVRGLHTWPEKVVFDGFDNVSILTFDSENVFHKIKGLKGEIHLFDTCVLYAQRHKFLSERTSHKITAILPVTGKHIFM